MLGYQLFVCCRMREDNTSHSSRTTSCMYMVEWMKMAPFCQVSRHSASLTHTLNGLISKNSSLPWQPSVNYRGNQTQRYRPRMGSCQRVAPYHGSSLPWHPSIKYRGTPTQRHRGLLSKSSSLIYH